MAHLVTTFKRKTYTELEVSANGPSIGQQVDAAIHQMVADQGKDVLTSVTVGGLDRMDVQNAYAERAGYATKARKA